MPLFEVDPDRAVLVAQQQDGANLATTAQRVVDGQIDSLLGEQIFPVSERRTEHEPYMLAIDAAGSPVVIEVVASLDEHVLTRAMRFAGAAGRLTRAQLANRYSRGPEAFERDLQRFRDDLPFGAVADPTPGAGARLVVICSAAREDVLDAVDFLRKPGARASVLRASVVTSDDGRRFVDVSPLVTEHLRAAEPVQRTIEEPEAPLQVVTPEPEAPRPVTSSRPTGTRRSGASPTRAAEPAAPASASAPAPSPEPVAQTAPAAPLTSRPLTRAERRARAAAEASASTPDPEPTRTRTETRSQTPSRSEQPEPPARPAPPEPTASPSVVSRRVPDSPPTRRSQRTRTPEPEPEPQQREEYVPYEPPADYDFYRADALADPLTSRTVPSTYDTPPSRSYEAPSAPSYEAPATPSYSRPDPAPVPSVTPTLDPDVDEVDPDLIALAQNIGFSAGLIWVRPRRGQRFEAVLHVDGQIELMDGSCYSNPDAAAIAASGASTADGWSVWRFGDGGPSLMDEFRLRFS
ncbi:hypothetical protein SAMN04489860_0914 [Paraoerskovia marina]|uniref:RAMA domain-containing protein n=1 Tax=Paraoerskovia marina TaxID=545619 RepID=A0A1H1PV49_9CELL|nr:hypothetical protein [Paraoerskovia marina]SDS15191.1 hypothetical protein SAMN04489860_0914 [Paraoerskovia marina]